MITSYFSICGHSSSHSIQLFSTYRGEGDYIPNTLVLGGCLHSKEKSSSPSNTDNSNAQFSPKVLQNNFHPHFNNFLQMLFKFSNSQYLFSIPFCCASIPFSSCRNQSSNSISSHLSHFSCPIPSYLSNLIPSHLISSPYSYCSYPVLTWEGRAHC